MLIGILIAPIIVVVGVGAAMISTMIATGAAAAIFLATFTIGVITVIGAAILAALTTVVISGLVCLGFGPAGPVAGMSFPGGAQ